MSCCSSTHCPTLPAETSTLQLMTRSSPCRSVEMLVYQLSLMVCLHSVIGLWYTLSRLRFCSCLLNLCGLSSWMTLMALVSSSGTLVFACHAGVPAPAATRNQLGRGACACQRPVFAGNSHTDLAEATIACQRPEWHQAHGSNGDLNAPVPIGLTEHATVLLEDVQHTSRHVQRAHEWSHRSWWPGSLFEGTGVAQRRQNRQGCSPRPSTAGVAIPAALPPEARRREVRHPAQPPVGRPIRVRPYTPTHTSRGPKARGGGSRHSHPLQTVCTRRCRNNVPHITCVLAALEQTGIIWHPTSCHNSAGKTVNALPHSMVRLCSATSCPSLWPEPRGRTTC